MYTRRSFLAPSALLADFPLSEVPAACLETLYGPSSQGLNFIFIPSGLEAVYLETHAAILRELFEDLLAAWSTQRLYDLKAPAGVWGHLAQSPGDIVLHLVAYTGTKSKKLQAREQFLPVGPIEARVRVAGPVQRAWQWSDQQALPFRMENGYAAFRLPEIKIHEGLVLEFS